MEVLQVEHGYSQRRACRLTGCHRKTARHVSKRREEPKLRERLRELAMYKKSWGYRMLGSKLRLEGWTLNHKRAYRIYKEEKLDLRPKHSKPGELWKRKLNDLSRLQRMGWARKGGFSCHSNEPDQVFLPHADEEVRKLGQQIKVQQLHGQLAFLPAC